MAGEWLSVRAYARHRGVSHTAIQKAILAQRVTAGSTRQTARGWTEINVAGADQDLAVNTDLAQVRANVRQPEGGDPADQEGQGTLFEPSDEKDLDSAGRVSYAKNRAIREAYLARQERLKFLELEGSLIRADAVRAERFRTARTVREAIMNIPARVCQLFAAESDADTIHEALEKELRGALLELAATGRQEALTSGGR